MYDKTYKWQQRKKNHHLKKLLEKKLADQVVTAKNDQANLKQAKIIKN